MISLHVPFGFFPDVVGGTEVYVAELAAALATQGHPAIVAAPGAGDADYVYQGLPVHRFAAPDHVTDVSELYGEGDPETATRFGRILDRVRPGVFHLHAFTRACSVHLVREAKARGIPVVFTYHTPTVSCQRGTLLEFGERPCDGRVDVSRCASCTLHGLGVNPVASRILGEMPIAVGQMLGAAGRQGGTWTALRMSSLIERRQQALASLFSLVDRIVALTPWVRELLKLNGVADEKIVISPHGIDGSTTVRRISGRGADRLRVAHLGRLDPVKGTALLIRALRQIPDAPIDLDVFGIVQAQSDAEALHQLQQLAAGDPRITFREPVEHSTVVDRLAAYDLIAVPSQWLETGPLVVLEAFAAGVPVIGSALGGLLDKVTDDVDGVLVRPHGAVDAWANALGRLAGDRALLARLSANVKPPRTVATVADEMRALYESVLPGTRSSLTLSPAVVS